MAASNQELFISKCIMSESVLANFTMWMVVLTKSFSRKKSPAIVHCSSQKKLQLTLAANSAA